MFIRIRTIVLFAFELGLFALIANAAMPTSPVNLPAPVEIPLYANCIVPMRLIDGKDVSDPTGEILVQTSQPTLTFYHSLVPGPAPVVLIFPGGAYSALYLEMEGHTVARRFLLKGFAAAVVKYRLTAGAGVADAASWPFEDARQALKIVRERAGEWHVDRHRVGLVGFSAGGHVAAMTALNSGVSQIPGDRQNSLRPDFLVLIYPVLALEGGEAGPAVRRNLLGGNADAAAEAKFFAPNHVTDFTPPTWIAHARDDTAVPVENSRLFLAALLAHHVPAKLLELPVGGHGFLKLKPRDQWFDDCWAWLVDQKVAPKNSSH